MKITKQQLKEIIKEELKAVMEMAPPQTHSYEPREVEQYYPKVYDEFGPYIEDGDLTIAVNTGTSKHFYKIKGGQFKPTGEISNATGGLPANVEDIRKALEQIPEPATEPHLEPDFDYYESIIRQELEQMMSEGLGTGFLIGGALVAAGLSGDDSTPDEVERDIISNPEKKRIAAELVAQLTKNQGFKDLARQWEEADNQKKNKPATNLGWDPKDLGEDLN